MCQTAIYSSDHQLAMHGAGAGLLWTCGGEDEEERKRQKIVVRKGLQWWIEPTNCLNMDV